MAQALYCTMASDWLQRFVRPGAGIAGERLDRHVLYSHSLYACRRRHLRSLARLHVRCSLCAHRRGSAYGRSHLPGCCFLERTGGTAKARSRHLQNTARRRSCARGRGATAFRERTRAIASIPWSISRQIALRSQIGNHHIHHHFASHITFPEPSLGHQPVTRHTAFFLASLLSLSTLASCSHPDYSNHHIVSTLSCLAALVFAARRLTRWHETTLALE